MTPVSDDKELVRIYVAEGSDAAFRALVARHVDLVYAAALRQVGDSGIAEEIAQNVFVALARKAPRLMGRETLAGWLYRTTMLETKGRIRAELRRRRREEKAVELAITEHDGTSPLEEMAPLLDEGLLHLREADRIALVLRFLENRSLREVGVALGVDDDAARKRISRALKRLGGFFRQQGFSTPSLSGTGALLAATAKAAPPGVAAAAAKAGLAAGQSAGGLNFLIAHLMALTKTETAALCLLIAAVPLTLQHRAEARVASAQAEIDNRLLSAEQTLQGLDAQTKNASAALLRAQSASSSTETRLALVTSQIQGKVPRPGYHWDEGSPLVRMPKAILDGLSISAVANHRGKLHQQITELLQMTSDEAQAVQDALDRFVAGFNAAQAATLRQVQPNEMELAGHKSEETRVFQISALGGGLGPLRDELFHQIEATLGTERSQVFRKALRDWMPLDDEYRGMNSGMAVFDFDHRVVLYKPEAGSQWLNWQIHKSSGGMMAYSVAADDVPPVLQPYVQDWITVAQSQPLTQDQSQR